MIHQHLVSASYWLLQEGEGLSSSCQSRARRSAGGLQTLFYYVGEKEGIIKCQQWSDATRGRDAVIVPRSLAADWTEPLAAGAGSFFLKRREDPASRSVTPD